MADIESDFNYEEEEKLPHNKTNDVQRNKEENDQILREIPEVQPLGEDYYVLEAKVGGTYDLVKIFGQLSDIDTEVNPQNAIGGTLQDVPSILPGKLEPGDRVLVCFYDRSRQKPYIKRLLAKGRITNIPTKPITGGVWTQLDGNLAKTRSVLNSKNQTQMKHQDAQLLVSSIPLPLNERSWMGMVITEDTIAILNTPSASIYPSVTVLELWEFPLSNIDRNQAKITKIFLDKNYRLDTPGLWPNVGLDRPWDPSKGGYRDDYAASRWGYLFYDTTAKCYSVVSPEGLHYVQKTKGSQVEIKKLKWPQSSRKHPEMGVAVANQYACRASWPQVGQGGVDDYFIEFFKRGEDNEWKLLKTLSVTKLIGDSKFNKETHRIIQAGMLAPYAFFEEIYTWEEEPGQIQQSITPNYLLRPKVFNSFITFHPEENVWLIGASWDELNWTNKKRYYEDEDKYYYPFDGYINAGYTLNYINPETSEIKYHTTIPGPTEVIIPYKNFVSDQLTAFSSYSSRNIFNDKLLKRSIRIYVNNDWAHLQELLDTYSSLDRSGYNYTGEVPTFDGWDFFKRPKDIDPLLPAWIELNQYSFENEGIGEWGIVFIKELFPNFQSWNTKKIIMGAPIQDIQLGNVWNGSLGTLRTLDPNWARLNGAGGGAGTFVKKLFSYYSLSGIPQNTKLDKNGDIYIMLNMPVQLVSQVEKYSAYYEPAGPNSSTPAGYGKTLLNEFPMLRYPLRWTISYPGLTSNEGPNAPRGYAGIWKLNYGMPHLRVYNSGPMNASEKLTQSNQIKIFCFSKFGEKKWELNVSGEETSTNIIRYFYDQNEQLLTTNPPKDVDNFVNVKGINTFQNGYDNPFDWIILDDVLIVLNKMPIIYLFKNQDSQETPTKYSYLAPYICFYKIDKQNLLAPTLIHEQFLINDLDAYTSQEKGGNPGWNNDRSMKVFGGQQTFKDGKPGLWAYVHVHMDQRTQQKLHTKFFFTIDQTNYKVTVKSYYSETNNKVTDCPDCLQGFQNIAMDGKGNVYWVDVNGNLMLNGPEELA